MGKRESALVKNTAVLSFGALCTKGIMFIMTPLITRWVSTSDYGTFDLVLSYVTLLVPILTLASGEAVFRFLLDARDNVSKKTIISTAFTINIIGIVFAACACCVFVFTSNGNAVVISAMFCYLIVEILFSFCQMTLRGMKRLKDYTLSGIIFVVGLSVGVLYFVFFNRLGLIGLFCAYITGDMVSIPFMIFQSKMWRYIDVKAIDFSCGKKIVSYSAPMLPNSISWWIVGVSDRTIVSLYLGTSMNAVLAVAHKIPNLCQTLFNVFHYSWQQSATESMNDADRDAYYSNTMNNMLKVVISICIVVLSFNYWFFKLLFSEEYLCGSYQVPIMVCAIVFSMLAQFIGGIYVAQKQSKKNGGTTVIAAVANVVCHIMLVRLIGLYAASLSTLVAYALLFAIRYVDIRKICELKFNKQTKICFVIFAYFVGTNYIHNEILSAINVFIACVVFGVLNYKQIVTMLSKILKKRAYGSIEK